MTVGPPTFNETVFRDSLQTIAGSPRFIDQAFANAEASFNSDKEAFISELENDEVTKSISEGSRDPEGYTDGVVRNAVDKKGMPTSSNLFAFFGFEIGKGDPTIKVFEYLRKNIKLRRRTPYPTRYKSDRIKYEFPIDVPLTSELTDESVSQPLPWGSKSSWLIAAEDGVDENSLFVFGYSPKSRSTGGVQLANIPAKGEYYRPPSDGYVITKLKKFIDKFRSV